jgi:hypothetical protein
VAAKVSSIPVLKIDLDDLTVDERQLVARFVDLVRLSRGKHAARSEFAHLLQKLAERPDAMTPEESEALALEAQRAVRRGDM